MSDWGACTYNGDISTILRECDAQNITEGDLLAACGVASVRILDNLEWRFAD
jgi:hypothetical protein